MSKLPKRIKDDEGSSSLIAIEPPLKKTRRATSSSQCLDHYRICQDLFDMMRNHRLADGRLLCEGFLRAPSKKLLPEYHTVVLNPMDLARIQQKMKNYEYSVVDQMAADVKLMIDNAKNYFKVKNSQEHKDACELWNLFIDQKTKLTEIPDTVSEASYGRSDNSSPAPSNKSLRSSSPRSSIRGRESSPSRSTAGSGANLTDLWILEQFLASVLSVNDETGRRVCHPFVVLPSREDYPDYYRVIKNPIDLKIIAERLRANMYKSLKELDHDLNAMCKNAKRYNEPNSLIYKDANFLKRFATAKRAEFVDLGVHGVEKIKNANAARLIDDLLCFSHPSGHHGSSVNNALEEDSEDDDTKFVPDDKFSALYTAIRYAKDQQEKPAPAKPMDLIEPFLRLPSRAFYPDYYDEIKQPMSLFIINRKIKMDEYNSFEEMVADMNLMFNNAKTYNVEGSVIYSNATKLQQICNLKVQKLDPSIDTSQYVLDILCDTSSLGGGEHDESTQSSTNTSSFAEFMFQKASPGGATSFADDPAGAPASKLAKLKLKRTADGELRERLRPGRKSLDVLMARYREKLLILYRTIVEHKDQYGRLLASAFMEKPSRKIYPSYYTVIDQPIDLQTINTKILTDAYDSADQLAADIHLMLNNAKTFNEEHSQIHNDAVILEKQFNDAMRQLGPTIVESPRLLKVRFGWRMLCSWNKPRPPISNPGSVSSSPSKSVASPVAAPKKQAVPKATLAAAKAKTVQRHKQQMALYQAVLDYADPKGRQLSNIFVRLPDKKDYPDYYEVIKRPIDMQKIHTRITSNNLYQDLDALAQDFMLMFDNACRYNDPESSIYKDALTLQKVVIEKKSQLMEKDISDKPPDIHAALNEIMTNIFISVYNYQDAQSRFYSDSLAELPDLAKDKESTQSPLQLDEIKRNIDRFRYRRLDRFQQDMFDLFDKARFYSPAVDAEIFDDSVELQRQFIKIRDEVCQNGKLYQSPALNFSLEKLDELVRDTRAKKYAQDSAAEFVSEERRSAPKRKEGDTDLDSLEVNGQVFRKSEFVYIKRNDEETLAPHIMRIERIWRDSTGDDIYLSGNWFYRPYETFHLATRKFLDKEVFKTEIFDMVDADRLIGKCCVLFTKDYVKCSVKNFQEADVYCCDTRYMGRMKHSFQKISHWLYDTQKQAYELVERPEPLTLQRHASVFVSGGSEEGFSPPPSSMSGGGGPQEKDTSVLTEEDDYTCLDTQREDVVAAAEMAEPDVTFYEQIDCGNGMWLKVGDGVYLRGERQLPDIVRVDKLWRKNGEIFLSGVWFARPQDVELEPDRVCFKKELFAVKRIDSAPLANVLSRCLVLSLDEFKSMRVVDIMEEHVFLCQSLVESFGKDKKQNPTGQTKLCLYTIQPIPLSIKALQNEVYRLKHPVVPEKVTVSWFTKDENMLLQSVVCELGSLISHLDLTDSTFLKTIPKLGARSKSGYILFSAIIRKKVMRENPDCPFGQISKLVGLGWKRLSDFEKKRFDEEADKIAQARSKTDLEEGKTRLMVPEGQIRVWFCKWKDCTWQFETADQLQDHITNMHTSQIIEGGDKQYICMWQTCLKYRKEGRPFPSLPRLNRHMKEKHVQVHAASKCMLPQNVGNNFVPIGAPEPAGINAYELMQTQPGVRSSQAQPVHFQAPMGAQQALRFQTPPPQQINVAAPIMIDAQGNILSTSGGQQYNVYQIQQQPSVMQQITAAAPAPQLSTEQQMITMHQQKAMDPGRTVVQRAAEPVFVIPPQRVQRVAHSEAYIRYLESLNQQPPEPTVSRWDRYLASTSQNTRPPAPLHDRFFERGTERAPYASGNKEQLCQAMWSLRDHLMNDSLQMYRFLDLSEM